MDADERQAAVELAYRVLDHRERTESELRDSLRRRGYGEDVIVSVIAEMKACGLVDDGRYAQLFAADKRRLDQWGSERIAHDLARRGVERELIDGVMAGVGRDDEMEAALDLLGRRFTLPFTGDKDRDRAWRLLVRRGYEPELAYAAVRAHEQGGIGRAA
jgi:regulatory protein